MTKVNALTPLFTFILEVEENNYGVKDNDANPANSIITMIDNCLQSNYTPLGVATKGDCTIALGNGKVFRLKQQARFKQKKTR
jgi:hypothetical protein